MYTCATKRDGSLHIIEYYMSTYKTYVTTCGAHIKDTESNTISLDYLLPNMCKICYDIYNKIYDDKKYAYQKSSLNIKIFNTYYFGKTINNLLTTKYCDWNRDKYIKRIGRKK